jgi:hypothetical protein
MGAKTHNPPYSGNPYPFRGKLWVLRLPNPMMTTAQVANYGFCNYQNGLSNALPWLPVTAESRESKLSQLQGVARVRSVPTRVYPCG